MYHYKERHPKETIEIISTWFTENNYQIRQEDIHQTEAQSWFCRITLFQNDRYILGSNGKGVNKLLCLASAYAELYERFCNYFYLIDNIPLLPHYFNWHYQKHGYYFHPNECAMTMEQMLTITPDINEFYTSLFNTTQSELFQKYFNTIIGGTYVGVPYNSYTNDQCLYVNPPSFLTAYGSCGCAAGNTIEEAIVQGLGELFEHHCVDILLTNDERNKQVFYYLNLDLLQTSVKNKQMIQNILAQGNQLYIYDLSYNFNLPVICSVLCNPISHTISFNCGSHPVFDIALERTLTEIYQGSTTFHTKIENIQTPFNSVSEEKVKHILSPSLQQNYFFPEDIFYTHQKIEQYNTKAFCKQQTNVELLQFLLTLCQMNNINIYWHDYSLHEKMKAIHLITPELRNYGIEKNVSKEFPLQDRVQACKMYLNYIDELTCLTPNLNLVNILNFHNLSPNGQLFFNILIRPYNLLEPTKVDATNRAILFGLFYLLTTNDIPNILPYLQKTSYFSILKPYLIIFNYINSGQYTKQNLQTIGPYLHLSTDEIEKSYQFNINRHEFIQRLILSPLFERFYSSEALQQLFNIYEKKSST